MRVKAFGPRFCRMCVAANDVRRLMTTAELAIKKSRRFHFILAITQFRFGPKTLQTLLESHMVSCDNLASRYPLSPKVVLPVAECKQ